ncbi:MAG: hypothetical protein V9F04_03300 [Dermatophilaceae bacterium]
MAIYNGGPMITTGRAAVTAYALVFATHLVAIGIGHAGLSNV